MKIDRRRALALLGLGGATSAGQATVAAPLNIYKGPVAFEHGVASGDPEQHSVIFWTRVTPKQATDGDVTLNLEIAADPAFKTKVTSSIGLRARASRDWTIKHDIDGNGLKPGTEYWYRFVANGVTSPVGRTKTLPAGPTKDVVLAVASCTLYPNGYFNAYDAIAKLPRVDAVLHLGDYIYEYGAGPKDYGMNSPTAKTRVPIRRTRSSRWRTIAAATPSTRATRPPRPPTPARLGSWSGTITRRPTTAGSAAPRTTIPTREKATGPRARPTRSRPITSGCRSAIRRAPCPRRPGAISSSATSPAC
jgi:phosphodiesterase/alkaline phosphatase D-like protein